MRWANRDRLACTSESTSTGDYIIGDVPDPSFQSPADLDDGDVIEGRWIYGSNWESGSYTKNGLVLERTEIYESTNGNAPVNWGPGVKIFGCVPLAANTAKSSDNSIIIEDDVADGKTNFRGLKLADVTSFYADNIEPGHDIKLEGDLTAGLVIHNLTTTVQDPDAETIVLDLSAGSTHVVSIAGNRTLSVSGYSTGLKFKVKLDYDEIGGHVVTWWDSIHWVNGYEPAFTPVAGGSDTFEFEVVVVEDDDEEVLYIFLGWILSTERPVIMDIEVTPNVEATVVTTVDGASGGPNEIRYLSATVNTDYMEFFLTRTGTVTGGVFHITLQAGDGSSYTASSIAYDATLTEILERIWLNTPFTNLQINVNSGVDGANCESRLTDVAASVGLQLLGPDRYLGWVMSINSASLTGGGSYDVSASGTGTGTQSWPFDNNVASKRVRYLDPDLGWQYAEPFTLEFDGDVTDPIQWGDSTTEHLAFVQAALEDLPSIGEGNIRVRAGKEGVYVFEFTGDLRNQDITGDIEFDTLPQNLNSVAAYGQVHGTTINGDGPVSVDEIQELEINGNPIEGYAILTILGYDVDIPVDATAEQIHNLLIALPEFYTESGIPHANVLVGGGPLPASPVTIKFIEELGSQDIEDSSIDTFSAGAAVIDWSICEEARVLVASGYNGGAGTYRLFHKNVIPGKFLPVTLTNVGTDFEAEFTTIQNGRPFILAVPPFIPGQSALNEVHRLTVTEDPLPTSGFFVVRIRGQRVEFAYNASNATVIAAIEAVIGQGVNVTGGPLPGTAIDITFTDGFAAANQVPSVVIYPATGIIEWAGVPVDWGVAGEAGDIPPSRGFRELRFRCYSISLIRGERRWVDVGHTVIEVRTDDPVDLVEGRMWCRSDL